MQSDSSTPPAAKDFKRLGTILILLGLLAMLAPLLTTELIAVLVGVLVTLGGLGRLFWAFQAPTGRRDPWLVMLGALTLAAGLFLLANPLFTVGVMVVILSLYLILDGISEILASNRARPAPGSGLLLLVGMLSILLGLMLWLQMPLTGAWAIGTLVGLKLLFTGLVMRSLEARAQSADAA